jgi:hypothetical protein
MGIIRDVQRYRGMACLGSRAKIIRRVAILSSVFLLCGASIVSAQQAGSTVDIYLYPDAYLSGAVTAQLNKTAEECRNICSSRTGCMGFDHVTGENMCRLFASVSSAHEAKSGAIAGSRTLLNGFRNPVNMPAAPVSRPSPPVVMEAPPVVREAPKPPSPPKPAATRCVVADPTDTPTNVRDGPNGNILTSLDDGASVVIQRIAKDDRGRQWAKVYGDAEGWIFRKFLRCR